MSGTPFKMKGWSPFTKKRSQKIWDMSNVTKEGVLGMAATIGAAEAIKYAGLASVPEFVVIPPLGLATLGVEMYKSGQKRSGGKSGDPTAKSSFSGGKTWEEAKKAAKGKFKLKK